MTRRALLLPALALLAGVALQSAAGAQPARVEAPDTVTLSVERFFDQSTKLHHFHFQGRLSSPDAGEYVAVLHRKCGQSFATAVAGATSAAGGIWGASPNVSLVAGSGTYQARWKDEVSAVVTVRPPIDVRAELRGNRKIRAHVTTYEALPDLRGRVVVLQSLRGGRWSDVQRARLRKDPSSGFWASYVATFTHPERGATLRAAVPATSVAPCFKRGATKKWTS